MTIKKPWLLFCTIYLGLAVYGLCLPGCATTLGYLAEDLGYVADRAQVRADAMPIDSVDKPETDLYAALFAGVGALAVIVDRRWFHRHQNNGVPKP